MLLHPPTPALRTPAAPAPRCRRSRAACVRPCAVATNDSAVAASPNTKPSPAATAAARVALDDMTVADVMTAPPITVHPEATVIEVLELLVAHKISGVPVVDARGRVLGVISGYDLLVLESTPGRLAPTDGALFPPVGSCDQYGGSLSRMWNAFEDKQAALRKSKGATAADMCHDAATIRADARLEEAADAVVRSRKHRLAVLDGEGRCVGVLSRGDLLRATLQRMRELEKGSG